MTSLEQRLRKLLSPDRVLTTPDALLAYECDALTIYKARPKAVALPETTEEVQSLVRLANEIDLPFVPRGAGTCLSGGPTPTKPAMIVETARMNKILEVSEEDLLAVVQPGVINLDLTTAVNHLGLHYAPDPSSQSVCTIGGNLAENSGGPHCFKYGMTTDHILGTVVVLPNGEVARLGGADGPRPPHGFDLPGLFTGSEGTFGIATEITVRLSRDPEGVHTMLASFTSMEDACTAVSDIVASGLIPAALEILDKGTIAAVEASVFASGYPTDAEAVLLVELDGPLVSLREETVQVMDFFTANHAIHTEDATDPKERKRLWKGRKGAFGAMGRLKPDLYVLDGVVPRTRLVETLQRVTEIGQQYGVTLTNVFHAGDGNLHPNISYDGRDAEEKARVMAAGKEILQFCMDMGGSITGEHGIGSEKLEYVSMMFSENDLEVMERVRRVFNPRNLCNPGKVIPERSSCAEVAKWPAMVERVLGEERET